VSPAYSTISQDYDKLRHVLETLTPGLVFAADAARYGKAIAATVGSDVEVVLAHGTLEGRKVTRFADLLATKPRRPSTPRWKRPAPTPSPSSCSPRARPSCPRR
jgi:feruloyl-CoA synthase